MKSSYGRLRWHGRVLANILVGALLFAAGCKTSEDAAAAATQMSATAKALSDYYTGLGTVLADTDQLYVLNDQLYAKPYSAENRALLKSNEDELAKRAALAADFSAFAEEFAKLSGSTAAADMAASAVKLQTEADSLASVKASTGEQNALKSALKLLVTAIQEHQERAAAKALDQCAQGLTDFFVKETAVWSSSETVYTQIASTLAGDLVDDHGVDSSAMLKVALDPFGLTPMAAGGDLNAKLAPLAKQQIAARKAALDDSYMKATDAMTKSLQEMSRRTHLVAEDKPMEFRLPPLTVATVEQWAAQIASY